MTTTSPDVLDVSAAAELAQVSEATVRRLCASGDIPAARIGRQWRIHGPPLRAALGLTPEEER